jgi:hypothetical protein
VRTLGKTLEYLALVVMMGGLTYYGSTKLSEALTASFEHSAQCIEDPQTCVSQ